MTAEARSLVRKHTVTGDLIHLSEGTVIQLSGMGPRRAGEAGKNLLGNGATALLSWGMRWRARSQPFLPEVWFFRANVIGADQSSYSSDPAWHGRLLDRLRGSLDLHQGTLAESVTVLKSSSGKENFV